MVQAFLIYFGLPNLGITFSAMTAGVLSMSLNTGAYIAEIVRSGIHAIDPGQREAAKAPVSYTHLDVYKRQERCSALCSAALPVIWQSWQDIATSVPLLEWARPM